MSSKLPILLVVAGVIYFISTASAEDGDDVGCMDEAACNYDDTATVDSGDCKYGDQCDDDDSYTPPGDPCDNIDTSQNLQDVFSLPMLFDDERSSNSSMWGQEKCYISQITVNQKDYVPGSQVIIGFDAQVRNKSKSRCGIGFYFSKTCKFAPTNGSTVGNNEGHLKFEVSIVPHGSTVAANSQAFDGHSRFTVYSNESEFDRAELPSPCSGANVCSILKDQWARYETSLTIPANVSTLGNYDIIIRSGLQSDWNSRKFRGIIVANNAFNVEDCENASGAENYETRFMSNQSFMTL
jgi:hypothetical protein